MQLHRNQTPSNLYARGHRRSNPESCSSLDLSRFSTSESTFSQYVLPAITGEENADGDDHCLHSLTERVRRWQNRRKAVKELKENANQHRLEYERMRAVQERYQGQQLPTYGDVYQKSKPVS